MKSAFARAASVGGPPSPVVWLANRSSLAIAHERSLERETGIEPATNSLEGCDSTTELLPPFDSLRSLRASLRALTSPSTQLQRRCALAQRPNKHSRGDPSPPTFIRRRANLHASAQEGWWGGEGSNLRSPKAAGLQPAAIDRSATSPNLFAACPGSRPTPSGDNRHVFILFGILASGVPEDLFDV